MNARLNFKHRYCENGGKGKWEHTLNAPFSNLPMMMMMMIAYMLNTVIMF